MTQLVKRISVGVLLLAALVSPGRAQGIRNTLVVTLLPEVEVDDTIIYLDKIARISGASAEQKLRLTKLDVAEFKLGAPRVTIDPAAIKFRLLLAGFDSSQFRIAGAEKCVITEPRDTVTCRRIFACAEMAIRQHVGNREGEIALASARTLVLPLIDTKPSDRVRYVPTIAGPTQRSVRVDVAVVVNGKTRETIPVHFDYTPVTTAVNPRRPFDLNVLPVSNPTTTKKTVVIRQRDLVKIVARVGPAQIEATGEAAEDGGIGDLIRVRNTESNRTVSGRVEARGIVIVE